MVAWHEVPGIRKKKEPVPEGRCDYVKLAKLFFVLAPLSGEKYHGDTEITKSVWSEDATKRVPTKRSGRAKFHLGLVALTRFNASNASIRPVRPFSIR